MVVLSSMTREEQKDYDHARYLRIRSKRRAQVKAWSLANPGLMRQYKTSYRQRNLEKHCASNRLWNKANPEKCRKACSKWNKRNPGKSRQRTRKRMALLRGVTFEDCSKKIELLMLERFCRWCCRVLTEENRTIDHVIPLARGGHHISDNLVAACAWCNSSRRDKLISEWLFEQKFAA